MEVRKHLLQISKNCDFSRLLSIRIYSALMVLLEIFWGNGAELCGRLVFLLVSFISHFINWVEVLAVGLYIVKKSWLIVSLHFQPKYVCVDGDGTVPAESAKVCFTFHFGSKVILLRISLSVILPQRNILIRLHVPINFHCIILDIPFSLFLCPRFDW